jgi:hypothetical protein
MRDILERRLMLVFSQGWAICDMVCIDGIVESVVHD